MLEGPRGQSPRWMGLRTGLFCGVLLVPCRTLRTAQQPGFATPCYAHATALLLWNGDSVRATNGLPVASKQFALLSVSGRHLIMLQLLHSARFAICVRASSFRCAGGCQARRTLQCFCVCVTPQQCDHTAAMSVWEGVAMRCFWRSSLMQLPCQ